MPAVAAEMRVQGEHLAIGVQLGEPHQARIGQRHGGVLIAAHQRFQRRRLGLELERDGDDAGLEPNLLAPIRIPVCFAEERRIEP